MCKTKGSLKLKSKILGLHIKNKNKTLALFGLIGAVLYAIVAGLVILLSKLLGEPGLTGRLESLFETTFFLPAFFAWENNFRNDPWRS
ncbi:MAG: hypothetical protein K6G00_02860 [Treponema sp.]|nr:hypothetical protein [Treponema sp.]